MTLILAIPTSTGIVLASDGQLTSGDVRSSGQKIWALNKCCAWGGAGELALIQRVREEIEKLTVAQPLGNLRDFLAVRIKECVTALLQLDFRTPFSQGNPAALLSLHPGDFVFAEFTDIPKILHVTSYGTPEWIERPYATGNGAPFAYALLQKYQNVELSLDRASLLAFKVIEEAIDVGAYGLGPPIHVWQINAQGTRVLSEAEVAALTDAAKSLRDAEIKLLLSEVECFVEAVVATTPSPKTEDRQS